jgi:hypothetical protein
MRYTSFFLKNILRQKENMKIQELFMKLSLATVICIFISQCKVDIRQIPAGRDLADVKSNSVNGTILIGKFEVFTADRIEFLRAWQYSFKSSLRNNRVFSEIKNLSDSETVNPDSLILDVEIYPRFNDTYNYWWTWPAIYPFVGYWPIQKRTGNYDVTINYQISKNKNILVQSSITETKSMEIEIYGFYRTSEFESMIEQTNLLILDKCAKEILAKLQ